MKRLRVGVLFGGRSSEHEVSLASGAAIMEALARGGHRVVPIGLARDGSWLVGRGALPVLARAARAGDAPHGPADSVRRGLADGAARQAAGLTATELTTAELAAAELTTREDAELTIGQRPAPEAGALVRASHGWPARLGERLDVVLVALHGPFGEDGTVQGLLELAGVPYTGAGVLASAVGMDKGVMKTLFRAAGLPVVDWLEIGRREWRRGPGEVLARAEAAIGAPCFVKPARLGSSLGISRVATLAELPAALDEAARHDTKLLIERAAGGREIEVGVLGNEEPEASLPGEVRYAGAWYDYATKYIPGRAELVVPAELPPDIAGRVRTLALGAFRAIDCAGMARVDFFVDGDDVRVNEINTIPGFTATSAYVRLWAASGVGYVELLDRLLALALARHEAASPATSRADTS